MDFSLTKEQKFFKDQVSRAMQRIVAPFADHIDKNDTFPEGLFRELGRSAIMASAIPLRSAGWVRIAFHLRSWLKNWRGYRSVLPR
jgi:alkylation response protein AidB-like acyl-CoA dehydrogenase